jgi:hypothetical protein
MVYPTLYLVTAVAALFASMVLALEAGRRLATRRLKEDPKGAHAGVGAVDGAVFGLLGLLIAFTFSGAASRFDHRRDLVVQEANAIGTAYLRLDVLPTEARDRLRQQFRDYMDVRLAIYAKLPDVAAAKAELDRSAALQNRIWMDTVDAAKGQPPYVMTALLAPLNEMIDITTTRTAATLMHPPPVIYGMLCVFALVSALLAGYEMGASSKRHFLHSVGFALILSGTIYVIVDLEFPRLGLIRVDAFDQVLVDVRNSMGN